MPRILLVAALSIAAGCGRSDTERGHGEQGSSGPSEHGSTWSGDGSMPGASSPAADDSTGPSDGAPSPSSADREGGPAPSADPASGVPLVPIDDQQGLLALIARPTASERDADRREALLLRSVGPGGPGRMNQGNPEIAFHSISRDSCLARLRDVVIQTPEQRALCGGHENMVPIYADGDPSSAKACIDVFEFPNRACELPFVWGSAGQARAVCKALGKRICTQQEWVDACSIDPAGGARWKYAYGNELDLEICNTNKRAAAHQKRPCEPRTIQTTWKSCSTNTEPSGAFPRCRSRLGIFDQHGNVAEAMSRYDPVERKTFSQLKGSAFFYVDVARKEGDEPKRENYVDVCAHDPRWHVQELARAWHVNYHLGFRCCLSIEKK